MNIKPFPIKVQQTLWRMTKEQKEYVFGVLGSRMIKFDMFMTFTPDENELPLKFKSEEEFIRFKIRAFCNEYGYEMDEKLVNVLYDTCKTHPQFKKLYKRYS